MIVDDCLPQKFFNNFVKEITNWVTFPWYYVPSTAFPCYNVSSTTHDKNEQTEQSDDFKFDGSWAHNLIIDYKDNSYLAPLCRKAVDLILKKTEETLENLYRVRLGLITFSQKPILHDSHVDLIDAHHKTGLLYLNNSDGDTIFYNKFYHDGDRYPIKCDSADISNRVSPKANRALTFDGWQYHSSSAPTKNAYRIVLNFNYNTK